jgi:hypothetical protein
LASTQLAKIKLPAGVPIGFLGETVSKMGGMPCAPAAGNYEVLYGKAGAPAFAITFTGAAHNDFTDNCTILCTTFCPGGTAPRDRTKSLAVKYVAAYFLWTLKGETAAQPYLDGAAFQKDVMAGYVTRVSK